MWSHAVEVPVESWPKLRPFLPLDRVDGKVLVLSRTLHVLHLGGGHLGAVGVVVVVVDFVGLAGVDVGSWDLRICQ